jgi:hypothetical protein
MPDLGQWSAFFNRVGWSKFLRGENDRGWTARFDWVLKAENFTKILEGQYDDKSATGQAVDPAMVREMERYFTEYGADGLRDVARELGVGTDAVEQFLREKEAMS